MVGLLFLLLLVLIILVATLFSRITSLSNRIDIVEWSIRDIRKSLPKEPETPQQKVSPQPAASVPPTTASQSPAPQVLPPPVLQQTAAPKPASIPIPEPKPSRTREELEAFIGGKLLNRIGALALVIGIGFFLKYAFDNNWISETMRIVIGAIVGIGVLFGGVRTHRKGFEIFAQGLFGAGISILYLSVYASFNFYHLVAQPVAFGMMSLVTIVAFVFAFKYNSLAISVLAWAGGFLTPFLLSTGSANEVGLFTYVTLLEAGLLAIVMKKHTWAVLEPLTLLATYSVFLLWKNEYYTDNELGITLFFVSVFWILLYLSSFYQTINGKMSQPIFLQLSSLFNAVIYYSIIYNLIDPLHHEWMGATSLILCLAYAVQIFVFRKYAENTAMIAQTTFISMALLVFATGIQYKGFTVAIFWSIEACVLAWCGQRWNIRYVTFFAAGLLACAMVKLGTTYGAFNYIPLSDFSLLLNYRALTYMVAAASLYICARILRNNTEQPLPLIVTGLHAMWIIVLLCFLTVEINDFFNQKIANTDHLQQQYLNFSRFMVMAVAWILYSLPLAYLGVKKQLLPVLTPALMIVAISTFLVFFQGIAFSPIDYFAAIINIRALAFGIVLSGMVIHILMLMKEKSRYEWSGEVGAALGISAVLLLLALLTGETRDIFELQINNLHAIAPEDHENISRIENLKQLFLSGLWMVYGGLLMAIGIWKRQRGMRMLSIVLLGIAILKIFIYDLSFLETLYRIFSFIGLGIILLTASYLYQKYKAIIFEGTTM